MSKGIKYPQAIVAHYGPTDQLATKLVVAIVDYPDSQEPSVSKKWFSEEGDVRDDPRIAAEVAEFIKSRKVTAPMVIDGVSDCPHDEGVDYPKGGVCPQCPFWAQMDRQTGSPIPNTVEEVLTELKGKHFEPPHQVLAVANRLRAELVESLLAALRKGIAAPATLPDDEAELFCFSLYLLASWREPRAYPLILEWLSLPGEGAFEIGGDILTEDGARILASVCDGDLEPIKSLIENRVVNEWARTTGIEALATLTAWGEVSQEAASEYFRFLARGGLQRTAEEPWGTLACACIDLGLDDLLPELRRACDEGLIDQFLMGEDDFEAALLEPSAERLAVFLRQNKPITDVAEAIHWWGCFSDEDDFDFDGEDDFPELVPEPYIAPVKIGRNDQCPCGSGKKYKKCCGSALN